MLRRRIADSAATGFLEPRWQHGYQERLPPPASGPEHLGHFEIVCETGRGGWSILGLTPGEWMQIYAIADSGGMVMGFEMNNVHVQTV